MGLMAFTLVGINDFHSYVCTKGKNLFCSLKHTLHEMITFL
jgi:hypothetical protein